MRKTLLICVFFILSAIVFSANKVSDIRFGAGQIIFDIEGKVPEVKIDFDDENLIIFLEFKDTTSSHKIKEMLNVDGKYVKDILKYTYENNTDFFITLKSGIEFSTMKLDNPSRFVVALKKNKGRTIVIDPGHGGKDPGAVSNGIKEKDVVLKIAKYLKKELENDYNVVLTRENDTFIPLAERPKIAEENNADLFISIHLNANRNRRARGAEVYYYSKKTDSYADEIAAFENSVDEKFGVKQEYTDFIVSDIVYHINMEKSVPFASDTLVNLIKYTGFKKRKVLGARFTVLSRSKMPAILVEAGFITNKSEASKLKTTQYQKDSFCYRSFGKKIF